MIPIVPVESDDTAQSLYAERVKLYPRAVSGLFAAWRWFFVILTQLIFYGVPLVQWQGHQIVLFDLEVRQFYIGSLVLWPQDFFLLTLLLIASALALFLFTTIGGRVWCGYACPQTVYTEMFLWIERQIQGDRYQRMRLDTSPATIERVFKKSCTQVFWIVLSLWTGVTFVGYFTPIRHLVPEIWNATLGPWESFGIVFYGLATYGNAGYLREQVCKYMCPYARFQSAMFDQDTLVVTYNSERGDPRGARSRRADPAQIGLGHCVDCGVCVEVCPTGIDIREGLQYERIGCGACIDGCNKIMDRMGYARGLIHYSTERMGAAGARAGDVLRRVVRPRVIVYSAILTGVMIVIGMAIARHNPVRVDVMRDRAVLSREVAVDGVPGWIENIYTLQIMNQDRKAHQFVVTAEGIDGARVTAASAEKENGTFNLPGATSRQVVISVRTPPQNLSAGSHRIKLRIQATDQPGIATSESTVFIKTGALN